MTDGASQPLKLTIYPLPDNNPSPKAMQTFWSGDEPSFQDVMDTINPLEHIPIVSTIYHAVAGDTSSAGAKIIGGALFGGPIGLLSALFDSIIQSATGKDLAGNVMAALNGEPVPALHTADSTQAASNAPPEHLGANQRAYYNAYLQAQSLLS